VNRTVLYTYWRSSASYRVRIALNLKGLEYGSRAVNLVRGGGEQKKAEYLELNPQGLVPLLIIDGLAISQSLAIIEYLEERWPEPPLLPSEPAARARVRSLALAIACDIHPPNNSGVHRYLGQEMGIGEEGRLSWYRHWIDVGFGAIETRLSRDSETGRFCHGDLPGLADIFLVPQVYNAQRFDCDMSRFPQIMRINEACLELEAFHRAAPESQPDAE
jgi:maleylacetoacetate isomerase